MAELVHKSKLVDRIGDMMFYGRRREKVIVYVAVSAIAIAIHLTVFLLLRGTMLQQYMPIIVSVAFALLITVGLLHLTLHYAGRLLLRICDARTLQMLRWRDLEILVAELYRLKGYKVRERTISEEPNPDGGIDLELLAHGKRYVVQCKKYVRDSIGVEQVRALVGVMTKDHSGAIFITTSTFTEDAQRYALERGNVELLDLTRLWNEIQSTREVPEALQKLSAKPQAYKAGEPCPLCGGRLMDRKSAHGPFVGCWNWRPDGSGCNFKYDPARSSFA